MWDSRFNIITSSSNPKLHDFYRVYFDKPSRKKQEKITAGSRVSDSYPNLRSTVERFSNRMPKIVRRNKWREIHWDPNFHVKTSKDNQHYYKDCREFFDSPVMFDHKSTSRGNTRSPLLAMTERVRKPEKFEKFYWNSLYEPISENNVVKHKAQRIYFS
jgi:hypothetical protein